MGVSITPETEADFDLFISGDIGSSKFKVEVAPLDNEKGDALVIAESQVTIYNPDHCMLPKEEAKECPSVPPFMGYSYICEKDPSTKAGTCIKKYWYLVNPDIPVSRPDFSKLKQIKDQP